MKILSAIFFAALFLVVGCTGSTEDSADSGAAVVAD